MMVGDGFGGGGGIEKRYYTYFVSREMGPPPPRHQSRMGNCKRGRTSAAARGGSNLVKDIKV